MGAVLTIAARDLKARLRDRTALIAAFVAPLVLATILSVALGGEGDFSTRFGVADEDGGPLASIFVDEVLGAPDLADTVVVTRYDDAAAARAAVDAEEVLAAFVVPAGFSDLAVDGAELLVLRSPTAELSGTFAESLAGAFVARIGVVDRTLATAAAAGAASEDFAGLAEAAAQGDPPVRLAGQDVDAARATAASYFGPSMAVFFVFFVVAMGPSSVLRERRQGTLARLHAAPVAAGSILAGKALAVLVLALSSMCVMWAVTSLALGANWGAPVGVLLVCGAIVLAAAAVTALIATLARTDEQVEGWTAIVVFAFALLGGNFAPAGGLPGPLGTLSLATPNGWAMRGFTDLTAGAGVTEILGPVAAILAFAVVAAALTANRAHRLVAP